MRLKYRNYIVSAVPLNPMPTDEGLTLDIRILASTQAHAIRRVKRYLRNFLVVNVKCA